MASSGIGLDEMLSIYTEHLSGNYPSPGDFQRRLDDLLDIKRKRTGEAGYRRSLEMNVIFLRDLVGEAEALVDAVILRGDAGDLENGGIERLLREMEEGVKAQTVRRHEEIFREGKDEEFAELRMSRNKGAPEYLAKLKFNYRYLMTLKILLFEFFNVLSHIRGKYCISGKAPGISKRVLGVLEFNAHYYLGNVRVADGDVDEIRSAPEE